MPLDSYRYQTTNNFEKLLDQKGMENIMIITTSIFLVFCMYIRPTRFLKDGAPNAKFDVDKILHPGSTGLN